MNKYVPRLKQKNHKILLEWKCRFLSKNNYSLRKSTHIGQALLEYSYLLYANLFHNVINQESRLKMKYSDDVICNIDETPITLNMLL